MSLGRERCMGLEVAIMLLILLIKPTRLYGTAFLKR